MVVFGIALQYDVKLLVQVAISSGLLARFGEVARHHPFELDSRGVHGFASTTSN